MYFYLDGSDCDHYINNIYISSVACVSSRSNSHAIILYIFEGSLCTEVPSWRQEKKSQINSHKFIDYKIGSVDPEWVTVSIKYAYIF